MQWTWPISTIDEMLSNAMISSEIQIIYPILLDVCGIALDVLYFFSGTSTFQDHCQHVFQKL